eukprot:3411269-Rhodomonas_salina.1
MLVPDAAPKSGLRLPASSTSTAAQRMVLPVLSTDAAYGATRSQCIRTARAQTRPCPFQVSSAISLPTAYAVSSTDIAQPRYQPTQLLCVVRYWHSPTYQSPMPCPVLTYACT